MTAPPTYRLVGGKIWARKCELDPVEHCNLSCRACSHLSPIQPRRIVEPDDVERDLRLLGRHYHARWIRLVGGEPLLHPNLVEVVRAARRSGLGDGVSIVTNGVLLPGSPDSLWQAVDAIEVSLYPGKSLSEDEQAVCRRRARAHGVDLRLVRVSRFRESYSELGTDNTHLTARIYGSCRIAHQWQCHTVAGGHFFKCPPAYFLPRTLRPGSHDLLADGIRLDRRSTLADELLAYLNDRRPLRSCANCLGTAGRPLQHTQVKRAGFRQLQARPTEELIDPGELDSDPLWMTRARKAARGLAVAIFPSFRSGRSHP